ncbi:MAG: alpha-galactosidase [Bacillales bacterium]|jgi:alpha-galactosidase|nr:alpha-galactosidase [Bacillales bacterium]
MFKICFLGAGSTIFAKNVLGDCILNEGLGEFEISLFDIDEERLNDSYLMLEGINKQYHGKAIISKSLNRKEALKGSKYIINAIQIGGYAKIMEDFEIPLKYGLTQTIGDSLGVAGIFRGLRMIKLLEEIVSDIHEVCDDPLFINYANPMAILTGYMEKYLNIRVVGLCHSVQYCVEGLLKTFKMEEYLGKTKWTIYGINHQAWLLDLKDESNNDLYSIIKKKNLETNDKYDKNWDLVRLDMLKKFGYYLTESSEHTSEYLPYYIKSKYPELIEQYKIPLDELPRRARKQITEWHELKKKVVDNEKIEHLKTKEFASYIIKAIENDIPYKFHGNVLNTYGLIPNLPREACVEVLTLVDKNGLFPTVQKPLPEVCAALNRTNINVQILSIEGAYKKSKEEIYQATCLDPHTSSELSLDDIKSLVDEMFEANKEWLYEYK